MPGVEERVSNLEGKVSEQSNAFVELRTAVGRLEQRMDSRFAALDDKMSRQFYWIIGIQITILIAMLGVALSRGWAPFRVAFTSPFCSGLRASGLSGRLKPAPTTTPHS